MLWNLTVHHRIHNSHPPVHTVSQIHSGHAFHPAPWLSILILSSYLSLSLPCSLFPLRFRIKLSMRLTAHHTCHKHLSGARHLTDNLKLTARTCTNSFVVSFLILKDISNFFLPLSSQSLNAFEVLPENQIENWSFHLPLGFPIFFFSR
jgi:hypothetical protein